MSSLYPVYISIAHHLQQNPEHARVINLDQLKPVIELSYGAPNILLDSDTLEQVKKIYDERIQQLNPVRPSKSKLIGKIKAKPKTTDIDIISQSMETLTLSKPKIKAVVKPKKSAPVDEVGTKTPTEYLITSLNKDHKLALNISQEDLKVLLEWSDNAYYLEGAGGLLDDKVYDYVKRLYNTRRLQTNDKEKTMASISSTTGVGCKQVKRTNQRDMILPIVMYSLDNLNKGEGDVADWTVKQPGPYLVSAKMDGMSALYYTDDTGCMKLCSRGDATYGSDISHIIQYLKLPSIPSEIAVRGELVISSKLFDDKYKGKKGVGGVRNVNRNSVAGAVKSIHHIDPEFLSDIAFVAYEIISTDDPQLAPSKQFELLEDYGFETAYHDKFVTIDDDNLSTLYVKLVDSYTYLIDGLVIITDAEYVRETNKNPAYARSFKEVLGQDMAVTEVIDIEWNPSQYGYLKPTIFYKEVWIDGKRLEKATGHNAREIINQGLGPGAVVEVVLWNKVNPRVMKVIKPVEPSMPKVNYVWVQSSSRLSILSGEPCDIKVVEGEHLEYDRMAQIKKIGAFLDIIGVKGIGEETVKKIYDANIANTVGEFISLAVDDIAFLGPNISKKHIETLNKAMNSITFPTLMAGSKLFGRGLGTKMFTKLFQSDVGMTLVESRLTRSEYISLFKTVEGFGPITATLAADSMDKFWNFVDAELTGDVYQQILDNTMLAFKPVVVGQGHPDIEGKNIYLTGFRDAEIIKFITDNGGTIQSGCNASTDMLIRKDSGYTNAKTQIATTRGIYMLDRNEFRSLFLKKP
jgi:DNA ligase (NAD+)